MASSFLRDKHLCALHLFNLSKRLVKDRSVLRADPHSVQELCGGTWMSEKLARNQWILQQRHRSTSAASVTHRRRTGSAAHVRRDPRAGSPVAVFARRSPIGCCRLCSWPAVWIPQLFLFKRCELVRTTTGAENRESQGKRRGRVSGGGRDKSL